MKGWPLRAGILRLVLFAGGWVILTEGSTDGAPIAVATIVIATAASVRLRPPDAGYRRNAGGLVRFLPFFVRQSFAGGLDVARRALAPRGRVVPAMIHYATRLPEGPARRFFAATVGLLPGSLTAEFEGNGIMVHVLDRTLPVERTLHELETLTAALFGVALDERR